MMDGSGVPGFVPITIGKNDALSLIQVSATIVHRPKMTISEYPYRVTLGGIPIFSHITVLLRLPPRYIYSNYYLPDIEIPKIPEN